MDIITLLRSIGRNTAHNVCYQEEGRLVTVPVHEICQRAAEVIDALAQGGRHALRD